MNSTVLKTLTGSTTAKLKNEKDLLKDNPSTLTATFTGVKKVYNLFPGTVLFLGFYKGLGTVTVKVSPYEILRYCNVTNINAWYNSEIGTGYELALADEHHGLQLEYCTLSPVTSKFPVRINDKTYYKQNPINILNGKWEPEHSVEKTETHTLYSDRIELTQDQILEWGLPKEYVQDPTQTITVNDLDNMPKATVYMLTDNKGDD